MVERVLQLVVVDEPVQLLPRFIGTELGAVPPVPSRLLLLPPFVLFARTDNFMHAVRRVWPPP